jgi:hypothetical protein
MLSALMTTATTTGICSPAAAENRKPPTTPEPMSATQMSIGWAKLPTALRRSRPIPASAHIGRKKARSRAYTGFVERPARTRSGARAPVVVAVAIWPIQRSPNRPATAIRRVPDVRR